MFIYRIREGQNIWERFARFGVRVKIAKLKFQMTNYFVTNIAGGYYCINGCQSSDDVLMFDPDTSDWKKVGSMKTARRFHGASLVNMGDVVNFC